MSAETKVRLFVQQVWGSTDPSRFPGPQPVSIERRHFPLLKRQPYLVCEKTDGVRHLLLSTEDGLVVLVNRAFSIDTVKIRIPRDTLLDGELVTSKTGKNLFMVYDAVRIKGEDLRDQPLDVRLVGGQPWPAWSTVQVCDPSCAHEYTLASMQVCHRQDSQPMQSHRRRDLVDLDELGSRPYATHADRLRHLAAG
jgi:hypothetical protein